LPEASRIILKMPAAFKYYSQKKQLSACCFFLTNHKLPAKLRFTKTVNLRQVKPSQWWMD